MGVLHDSVLLPKEASHLRINHLSIIVCVLSCRASLDAFNLSACLLELCPLTQPVPWCLPYHVERFSGSEFKDTLRRFPFCHPYAPPFSFRPVCNRCDWEIRHRHGIDGHCPVSCKRSGKALNQMPLYRSPRFIRSDDFNKVVLKYVHHLYA